MYIIGGGANIVSPLPYPIPEIEDKVISLWIAEAEYMQISDNKVERWNDVGGSHPLVAFGAYSLPTFDPAKGVVFAIDQALQATDLSDYTPEADGYEVWVRCKPTAENPEETTSNIIALRDNDRNGLTMLQIQRVSNSFDPKQRASARYFQRPSTSTFINFNPVDWVGLDRSTLRMRMEADLVTSQRNKLATTTKPTDLPLKFTQVGVGAQTEKVDNYGFIGEIDFILITKLLDATETAAVWANLGY